MDDRVKCIHNILHAIDQLDHSELSRGQVKAASRGLNSLHQELLKSRGIDSRTDSIAELLSHAEKGNWTELNRARNNGKMPAAKEELRSISKLQKANEEEALGGGRYQDSGKDRGYPPQHSASSDNEYERRRRETQMEHRDRRPMPGSPWSTASFDSPAPSFSGGNPKINSAEVSRLAGQKLRNGNTLDLRDTESPSSLVEAFSNLYNQEWADAYDEIITSTRDVSETIKQLTVILEEAYKYCSETAERQMTDMLMHVEDDILYPNITQRSRAALEANQSPDRNLLRIVRNGDDIIKEFRRNAAAASLPVVKWLFYEEVMKGLMPAVHHTTKTVRYVDRCLELTWMMCVQNQPIHLQFCKGGDKATGLFKPFTKSGSVVQTCVWPAVYLHKDGKLLQKGIAHLA